MSDIGEKLSAASLLFTCCSLFFSLIYSDVERALCIVVKDFAEDNKTAIKSITQTIYKTFTIALLSLGTWLVFFPDACAIICITLPQFTADPVAVLAHYDAIATSFVLVNVFAMSITGIMFLMFIRLLRKRDLLWKPQ
jgi:hypothetical protein